MGMCHWGMWSVGTVGLVGLGDLRGPLQPEWFYDFPSVTHDAFQLATRIRTMQFLFPSRERRENIKAK